MIARLTARWRTLRRTRRVVVVAGVLLAIATTMGLVGLALTRLEPSWWREVSARDPATVEAAERVENAVLTQISLARRTDPGFTPQSPGAWRSEKWAVSLGVEDANAWLNARLPRWLANRERQVLWPPELNQVQVDFSGGAIRIGVELGRDGQILVAEVKPELRADGSLWLPAEWLAVGGLAIPAPWVIDRVDRRLERYIPPEVAALPELRQMLEIFSGRQPVLNLAAIRLDDGRRVRLLKLTPRNGRLEIECRTEKE